MKFWWVNHNQTHNDEVGRGFLWSPKRNANGARNKSYENMTQVKPGDVVFSFANTKIQAIGKVIAPHESAPMPSEFEGRGFNWNADGWFVQVDFKKLQNPMRPKDHIDYLRDSLADSHSPINPNGNGNQSMYLSEVPHSLVEKLILLLGDDFHNTLALAGGGIQEADSEANEVEKLIEQRTDIGITQIKQLVNSRRGQGIFKTNIKLFETKCRLTGLEIHQHLIASHIKPWSKSDDFEKLDGNNGLLLSPHVDHLFNYGYISMENNGQLIVSKNLQYRVLSAWKIDPDQNVGNFNKDQQKYLEYHRDTILKNAS